MEEIYSGPPDNVVSEMLNIVDALTACVHVFSFSKFSKLLKGYLPKSIRVGLISIGKHLTSGIIDEESFLTKKTLNIDFAYSASGKIGILLVPINFLANVVNDNQCLLFN